MRHSAPSPPSPWLIVLRVLTALIGGYVFAWGLVTVGVVGSVAAGYAYDQAFTLFTMVALLLYPACSLWAFSARSLRRVFIVLVLGGAAMMGVGMALVSHVSGAG